VRVHISSPDYGTKSLIKVANKSFENVAKFIYLGVKKSELHPRGN
jgi:hypothetical protein